MDNNITINNNNGLAQSPMGARKQKRIGVAYVLLLFFGLFGVHQFYLGKGGRGLLYLFTLAFLGVAVLVDLFTLPSQTKAVNTQRALGLR